MRRILAFGALVLVLAAPARAGDVLLEFRDGYVTLSARDASVRQILQEWSRVGNTRVVNADKVPGSTVTLELQRVPEKQALKVLLRSVAGYIAAPRMSADGASAFARIVVMPPSSAPPPRQPSMRPAMRRPPLMQPPVMPQQPPPVLLDDQGEPIDPNTGLPLGVQPDPTMPDEAEQAADPNMPPPAQYPGVQPYPGGQPYAPPGDPPPPNVDENGMPEAEPQPQPVAPGPTPGQGTVVSPAPGQLPVPESNRQPRR